MTQALHDPSALPAVLAGPLGGRAEASPEAMAGARGRRIHAIVTEHYAFLWRSLRRLGLAEADVEDAAQNCLWVVAQRMDDIVEGKEKTFLFGVALRVARTAHRVGHARLEVLDERVLAELPAPGRDTGEELDDRRARLVLDALLASLPLDLRSVFVLYELEELTMAEIAAALELPPGTVASRLRRAPDWAANLDFTVFPVVARRGPGDEVGSLEGYVVGGVGVVAARPIPVVDPAHRWFDDSYMLELAPGLGLRVFVAQRFAVTFEVRDRMYFQKVESPVIASGRFGPSDVTTWYDRSTQFTNAFEIRVGGSFFAGP